MRMLALVLAAVLAAPAGAAQRPSTGEIERRTDALAAQLRCPVCQQLSIKDSPSEVAAALRRRIRELVAEGRGDEEVRAFFVARYGEWILLSPPRHGTALAVWVLPPLLVLTGALVVALAVRRWTRRSRALEEAGARHPEAVERARRRLSELERGTPG